MMTAGETRGNESSPQLGHFMALSCGAGSVARPHFPQ